MRDNVEAESPEDYFRKSITTFSLLYAKWNEGLPTYTPEPLWDYSWFHQLLKILLHSWAPPPVNRVSGSAPEMYYKLWQ
jgi:hypothetical protein